MSVRAQPAENFVVMAVRLVVAKEPDALDEDLPGAGLTLEQVHDLAARDNHTWAAVIAASADLPFRLAVPVGSRVAAMRCAGPAARARAR